MAAYNWIEVKMKCPNCGGDCLIKCQTHIASSYDGTQERFRDKTYSIGDRMNWFDSSDDRYNEWKQGNSKIVLPGDVDSECCYGVCHCCEAECFVVIKFDSCVVSEIESIGLLNDWPSQFYE